MPKEVSIFFLNHALRYISLITTPLRVNVLGFHMNRAHTHTGRLMSISHSFCTNSFRLGPSPHFKPSTAMPHPAGPRCTGRSQQQRGMRAAWCRSEAPCHSETTAVVPSPLMCLWYCCARLSAGCHGFHYATGGVSLENSTRLMHHGGTSIPPPLLRPGDLFSRLRYGCFPHRMEEHRW